MIFAHKGYKEILKDSWDEWVKLINDDQEYCNKLRYTKPIIRIKIHELPSWHPYWKKILKEKELKSLKELKNKYKMCKENLDLIKIFFNKDASLKSIKK